MSQNKEMPYYLKGAGSNFSSSREIRRQKIAEIRSMLQGKGIILVLKLSDLEGIQLEKITPSASYIRYSSKMQDESFSLEAQAKQIMSLAEKENMPISIVFADVAKSAYKGKERPGYEAMKAALEKGMFTQFYIHKIDRLQRSASRSTSLADEFEEMDIEFKAVQQSFDYRTPEGKMMFTMLSAFAEFYSANLAQETIKGKFARVENGYHNGIVPWGYESIRVGERKIGQPIDVLEPVVAELFERYATGIYSDQDLADWLDSLGYKPRRNPGFGKDSIREILTNPFYMGYVRYKGFNVRKRGVSYRATEGNLFPGKHKAIIGEDLWNRCQEVRAKRATRGSSKQWTRKVYLANGLIVCAYCNQKLRAQTTKVGNSYYRASSRTRGYRNCPYGKKSVNSEIVDEQIEKLILEIKLPEGWEDLVKERLCDQKLNVEPDPEKEKKDIRAQLRRMRDSYNHGMYDGDEYLYWREVEQLKAKLIALTAAKRVVSEKAVNVLLNLQQSWEVATKAEQRELVQLMFDEIAVDLSTQMVKWVQPKPDFNLLLSIIPTLRRAVTLKKVDDMDVEIVRYWLD
jgi:DNA invertase Pin-like site-specific DNA recombinase